MSHPRQTAGQQPIFSRHCRAYFFVGSTQTLRFVPLDGRQAAGRRCACFGLVVPGPDRSPIYAANVQRRSADDIASLSASTAEVTHGWAHGPPCSGFVGFIGLEGSHSCQRSSLETGVVGARRVDRKQDSFHSSSSRLRTLSSPTHSFTSFITSPRTRAARDRCRRLLYANLSHSSIHHLSQGCTSIIN